MFVMTNTSSRSDRTMVLRSSGNERLLKLEMLSAKMVAVVGSKMKKIFSIDI